MGQKTNLTVNNYVVAQEYSTLRFQYLIKRTPGVCQLFLNTPQNGVKKSQSMYPR